MPNCPSCGEPIAHLRDPIEWNGIKAEFPEVCSHQGRVTLSPNQFDIVAFVLEHKGGFVQTNRIFDFLYWERLECDEDGLRAVLKHQIWRAQKKLESIGISLRGYRFLGYRIEVAE